jgi:hypothetical protein
MKAIKKEVKRRYLSLEDKCEILNRIENGDKIVAIATDYNVNESTVRTFKVNKQKIRESLTNAYMYGAKHTTRTRDLIMGKMERALMIWFEDCIAKKIPISGDILKAKALQIFDHLKKIEKNNSNFKTSTFVASKGWFHRFKKRFSLRNIKF